jgi:hypothetical protein
LGYLTDGCELKDAVVPPDTRWTLHHHMWPDPGTATHFYIGADNRVSPDIHIGGYLGSWINNSPWIDH